MRCACVPTWEREGEGRDPVPSADDLAPPPHTQSKLLEPTKSSEKMYMIDEHIACAVAGITADANILINQARGPLLLSSSPLSSPRSLLSAGQRYHPSGTRPPPPAGRRSLPLTFDMLLPPVPPQARLHAQRYRFAYQEPQPVEQLVQSLCDEKQAYTQYGGLRPFGVSMLYAGWDKTFGYQLYQSDPSGNYLGWKATCIGANNQSCARQLTRTLTNRAFVPLLLHERLLTY